MIRFKLRQVMDSREYEGRPLTGYRLAKLTGLTEAAVSNLLRRDGSEGGRIDLRTLDALCATLRCKVGDLLEHVPDGVPTAPRSKR